MRKLSDIVCLILSVIIFITAIVTGVMGYAYPSIPLAILAIFISPFRPSIFQTLIKSVNAKRGMKITENLLSIILCAVAVIFFVTGMVNIKVHSSNHIVSHDVQTSSVKDGQTDGFWNALSSAFQIDLNPGNLFRPTGANTDDVVDRLGLGEAEESTEVPESKEDTGIYENPMLTKEGTLEVHFIDVWQGDATLVLYETHAMLIDAGNNDYGQTVLSYLDEVGVNYLDVVIATHPDADHIGGLDDVIDTYPIGTIYMTAADKNTYTYEDVMESISDKGYEYTIPTMNEPIAFGDATFTFLGPIESLEDINDNSIVTRIDYKETSYLFMGDAEEAEELSLLNAGVLTPVTLLKVGHHGSNTSSSQAFLEAVMPTYAVISCGMNNEYFHPHGSTLNALNSIGVFLYRTDEQGTIKSASNGSSIGFNASPSTTWKAGEGADNG